MIVAGDSVRNMLLLHRCVYYVGALVKVRAQNKAKEYEDDHKRWLYYIRSHIGRIIKCKEIPMYWKALITGGCISPLIMSKLDTMRGKRIADRSVSM